MKRKLLFLLLILGGMVIISGCVYAGDNAGNHKIPNIYRSIFYPYAEPQENRDHERPHPGVQEVNSSNCSRGPGFERVHDLRDAVFILDRNIRKAEVISSRIEEGIDHYKAEGKDVSKLESLLKQYNLLVGEAKKYRALADSAAVGEENSTVVNPNSEDYSSENTSRDYLVRSQKSMIQASVVLKEIFNEFQRLMPGSEDLNSTSRLSAAGAGRAYLTGNFTLDLHLERGDVAIPDLSTDSMINITGDYVFEKKTDKQQNELNLYHIYSADMKISGSRKSIYIRGSNIILNAADGEGYVLFQGDGTYRIEEADGKIKEQNWANPFPKQS